MRDANTAAEMDNQDAEARREAIAGPVEAAAIAGPVEAAAIADAATMTVCEMYTDMLKSASPGKLALEWYEGAYENHADGTMDFNHSMQALRMAYASTMVDRALEEAA